MTEEDGDDEGKCASRGGEEKGSATAGDPLPAYGLSNLTGGIGSSEFGFALIMLIVTALASRSWVLIVLALSANEALANVALVISNILFFLLAGFLIRSDEIEASYYWFHVIDYFSYTFRALAVEGAELHRA